MWVRHHVHHLAHAVRPERNDKPVEVLPGADLGIERAVIDDVVAVQASRAGLEIGRTVHVGDTERGEIRHELGRARKRELAIEL
jgi:hypothetical protein